MDILGKLKDLIGVERRHAPEYNLLYNILAQLRAGITELEDERDKFFANPDLEAKQVNPNDPFAFHRILNEKVAAAYKAQNHTLDRLESSHSILYPIAEYLEKQGIRSLKEDPARGRQALVFFLSENEILRIAPVKAESPFYSLPQVLEPLVAYEEIQGMRMEVLPYVRSVKDIFLAGKVTEEQAWGYLDNMISSLAKHDPPFLLWNAKIANIGLLDDGTPVVIDRNAVIPVEKMYERKPGDGEAYIDCLGRMMGPPDGFLGREFSETLFASIKSDPIKYSGWEEAQKKHVEGRGLEYGKVQAVITEESLRDAQEKMGGENNVYSRAVDENGMYKWQFGSLADGAARDHDETSESKDKPRFCELIEKRRADLVRDKPVIK